MKMGGSEYIEKPFRLKDLVKAISTVLAPADPGTKKPASQHPGTI
jgi:DNA-binding response OmpR family regulator